MNQDKFYGAFDDNRKAFYRINNNRIYLFDTRTGMFSQELKSEIARNEVYLYINLGYIKEVV